MTDDDLEDALTSLHGIGPAKAGKIIAVVEAHADGTPPDAVAANLRQAADYHDAGDHAYAAKFVRRAADALDGE